MYRPMLEEVSGIIWDLTRLPTSIMSYEHCYRRIFQYSSWAGLSGMEILVHEIVPGIVATAFIDGIVHTEHTTVTRVIYDVMLYPMRVLNISFAQFGDIIRGHLMRMIRPVRYIHDRSIGKPRGHRLW